MINYFRTIGGTSLLAVACILMSAEPASAQDAPAARSTVLEEIVVTARKTRETEQSLPISISAFSQAELENKVIQNVQDLEAVAPGLNVADNNQGGAPVFAIRGTATANLVDGGVAVYLDDVPLVSTIGVVNAFYDIDSVEILKGPQGTQFGTNTTGGTISVRATKPNDELEGYIKGGYGDYDRREFEGMINLPVNDFLKFRVAGNYVKRDGFVKNPDHADITPSRYFSDDHWSLRASMRMETERVVSDVVFDYYDQDDLKTPNIPIEFRDTAVPGANPADFGAQVGDRDHIFIGPNVSGIQKEHFNRHELWGIQHVLEIEFSDTVSLRNVIGYRDDLNDTSEDNGGTPFYLIEVLTRAWAERWIDDLTLRFNLLDGRMRANVGGFYLDDERKGGVVANAAQTTFMALGFGPLTQNIRSFSRRNFESKAVYTNVDYDLTDRLTFAAGFRYNWDSGDTEYTPAGGLGLPDIGEDFLPDNVTTFCNAPALVPFPDVDLVSCIGRNDDKWRAESWNIGLNYQAADHTLVYGKVSHGYLAGGFNLGLREVPVFEPETNTQWEAGVKSDWTIGGRPIRTNVAVYYGIIDDKQVVQNTNYDDGTSANGVFNAAKQEVYGTDIQIQYSPADGLMLDASWAYLHAKFDKFAFPAIGGPVTTLQPAVDLSGNTPATTPKHQIHLGVSYVLPIESSAGEVAATFMGYFTDDMVLRNRVDDENLPYVTVPSYWVFNGSITWDEIFGSGFSAQLWGKNLFDKEYINSRDVQFGTFGYATVRYGEPRTYGLSVAYSF